jgi:hypothetical protein
MGDNGSSDRTDANGRSRSVKEKYYEDDSECSRHSSARRSRARAGDWRSDGHSRQPYGGYPCPEERPAAAAAGQLWRNSLAVRRAWCFWPILRHGLTSNPTTGIVGCCAPLLAGHAHRGVSGGVLSPSPPSQSSYPIACPPIVVVLQSAASLIVPLLRRHPVEPRGSLRDRQQVQRVGMRGQESTFGDRNHCPWSVGTSYSQRNQTGFRSEPYRDPT